ncbi:hypothetical protein ACSBM8_07590 [Sphingomonas sp. ASY06-1R]|uniref:hypothetical protein n=1 Tax=Sphingomonas sp. ASY06-1R TaxID=3445771 RepID=UPI003FA25578
MAVRTIILTPLLSALLLLPGCASQISAPSLGPRAVEKQPIDMPLMDGSEAEHPADAALTARIASLVAAAETGQKDFAAHQAGAATAISRAAGTGVGSDAWIAAQQALTSLDSARAATRDAAAALDALRDDPANAAPGNRKAIDAAAAEIAQIAEAQSRAVGELSAKLN